MKTALVLGAGGFIGNHLVNRLKSDGYFVRGVDLKHPEFSKSKADDFEIGDLKNPDFANNVIRENENEIFQLAAEMGGAGYIFTGNNDSTLMHNSSLINLNVLAASVRKKAKTIFFSSSACVYPEFNQIDPQNPNCSEESVYPAFPDSEYGWEKLYAERLYMTYAKNHGLNVKIARFHNIYGPEGTWTGGREKAPAALCRKIAEVSDGGEIKIWGDGLQTRSCLYIDDCLNGVLALMKSDFSGPVNIGSEEMISISDFAKLIMKIAGKNISISNIPGPTGVRGRNSDNRLMKKTTGWEPLFSLEQGVEKTYSWIENQVHLSGKILY